MMKLPSAIFLLISQFSFAQYKPNPTNFDSFIIRPNVEWAAYANDYICFEKNNLGKLLFTRFVKNEIKVSLPEYGIADMISKDSLDQIVLYPLHHNMPSYDSLGNAIYPEVKMKPFEIDTTNFTSITSTQILYIENGILKSYVPWVTPSMVKIKTQANIFLGYSEYFSSCYNYDFNYQPGEKNEIVYLGETNRKLILNSIGYDYHPIKELYNRNLLETLLPYFWTDKLDIYSTDLGIKLKKEDLYDHFDSSGDLIKNKYLGNHSSLEDFKEIQLVQDWYYNHDENIVFNKIKALFLCAKRAIAKGEEKEASPVLKIVFR